MLLSTNSIGRSNMKFSITIKQIKNGYIVSDGQYGSDNEFYCKNINDVNSYITGTILPDLQTKEEGKHPSNTKK